MASGYTTEGLIKINFATKEELMTMSGMSDKKAKSILKLVDEEGGKLDLARLKKSLNGITEGMLKRFSFKPKESLDEVIVKSDKSQLDISIVSQPESSNGVVVGNKYFPIHSYPLGEKIWTLLIMSQQWNQHQQDMLHQNHFLKAGIIHIKIHQ